MLSKFFQWLPPESIKILLVLGLSLLVGSEREEHKASTEQKTFGGVRTYPLIGLIGYAMALLGAGQLLPLTLGFAVVGGFLLLSYWHDSSGFYFLRPIFQHPARSHSTALVTGMITARVGV